MTKQDMIQLYIVEKNIFENKVAKIVGQPNAEVLLADLRIEFSAIMYSATDLWLSGLMPNNWRMLATIYVEDLDYFIAVLELILFTK